MSSKAVMIGAGVAGLATALKLGQGGGWSSRLIERDDRPGGLAKCLRFEGVSTDMGPHRIHTEIPEVEELIQEIAGDAMYKVKRRSHIYLRGHYLEYPPAPVEMALRLGPHRLAAFMGSYALTKLAPAPATETYESLMAASFGKGIYNFLIKPYTEKTWKVPAGQLHADTARVRVSAGSLAKMVTRLIKKEEKGQETALKEFRYVKGGVESLVRLLVDKAEAAGASIELERQVRRVMLNEAGDRVVGIEHGPATQPRGGRPLQAQEARNNGSGPEAGGAMGAGELGAGDLRTDTGDLYCSTVPLPVLLGRLLPDIPALADARDAAAGLQYIDMMFVVLIVNRKVISGSNWLYFPEPHLIFNRGYEAKTFDPEICPEDKSVICLEITMLRDDPIAFESDASIIAQAREQICGTGLMRDEEIEQAHLHRLPYGYPLYTLDYDTRLDRVFAGLAGIKNLITIGRQGLFNHNNMDHSMYMGIEASKGVLAHGVEGGVKQWYDTVGKFKKMRIVD